MHDLAYTHVVDEDRVILFTSARERHKASTIKLHHDDGTIFELDNFRWTFFTHCFSENKNHGFRTKVEIPDKFLQNGVKIELMGDFSSDSRTDFEVLEV